MLKQIVVVLIPHATLCNTFLAVANKNDPFCFDLPGGEIKNNETLLEGINKKGYEQTGLIFFDLIPFYQDRVEGYFVTCFLGSVIEEIDFNNSCKAEWVARKFIVGVSFKEYYKKVFELFDGNF